MSSAPLETIQSACAHVAHEYGTAYRLEPLSSSTFEVTASDGGRFHIEADRYGNAWRLCDGKDYEDHHRRDPCFNVARRYVPGLTDSYLCETHLALWQMFYAMARRRPLEARTFGKPPAWQTEHYPAA